MTLVYMIVVGLSIIVFLRLLISDYRRGLLAGLVFISFTPIGFLWQYIPIPGIGTIVKSLFLFLSFSYYVLKMRSNNRYTYFWNPYVGGLVIFALVVTGYIMGSADIAFGISKTFWLLFNHIIPIIILYTFRPLNSGDHKVICLTIIIGAMLATLDFLAIGDFETTRAVRLPLVYARTTGLGVISLVIILLSKRIQQINIVLVIQVALLLLLLAGMMLTGSRGPIVALVTTIIFFVCCIQRNIKRRLGLIVKLGIVISIALLIIAIMPFSILEFNGAQRIYSYFSDINNLPIIGQGQSDSDRRMLFEIAKAAFVNSNGIGIGTGGYANLVEIEGGYAHNIFLDVAGEQGFIGLSVLLYLFAVNLARCLYVLRVRRTFSGYEYVFLTLWFFGLLNAQVSGDISNNLLWLTWALIWFVPTQDGLLNRN